jgi:hypothetical protein
MSCMVITTHTIVVELSGEVVVSFMKWLFGEATTPFSLLALSPSHHQRSYVALHETTYETFDVYQCTRSKHNKCTQTSIKGRPNCVLPDYIRICSTKNGDYNLQLL